MKNHISSADVPARDARIRELHGQGMGDREIAAAIGRSFGRTKRLRIDLGLTANVPGDRHGRGAQTRAVRGKARREGYAPVVQKMLHDGLTYGEIAAQLGFSESQVHRIRREAGIQRGAVVESKPEPTPQPEPMPEPMPKPKQTPRPKPMTRAQRIGIIKQVWDRVVARYTGAA